MKLPSFCFERLAGAALGTICGDALGMPVEGFSAQHIQDLYGLLDEMKSGRLPAGHYTDDSQMMLAILETLAQRGCLDPAYLAGRFLANFEPQRGYGGRIHGVMQNLAGGADWDQVGTDSYGNGGAMRVGVVGAFLPEGQEALKQVSLSQCRITHKHPRGLAGAAAQALAVGLACRSGASGQKPPQDESVAYLAAMVQDIDLHLAGRIRAMPRLAGLSLEQARQALTSAYACDVTAAEAVPPALGAFLWADSCRQAIVLAVSLGGDTDTIGAMTGALAGAFWGMASLPQLWLDALENGPMGRDYAISLCKTIADAKTG